MVEVAVRLSHLLPVIAGGRPEVFENAPGDRIRYAAMGGVILSTAAVAAASAAMAVHTAMRMPVLGAIAVGLAWGFIIFNLDRLLVVQMMRQQKKKMALLAAVPRVLLAIVLGAVISTPVVLQIFKPEIDTELLVLQAQKNADFSTQTSADPDFAQIPVLTKAIAADQATIDNGVTLDVESVPEVVQARNQYDAAQKAYTTAEHNVVCEKEGKCGSGHAGAGIAYNEKVGIRADAKATRDAAKTRLDTARTTAQQNLGSAQNDAVAAAKADKTTLQTRLDALNKKLDATKQAHDAQTKKDDGLLARLEALDQLSADRPTLQVAHLTLFLLFLSIELLPVLMKLLQVLGPETAYDKRAAENDDHYAEQARNDRDADLEVQRSRLDARIASEQVRIAHGKDATDAVNDEIIETQREVMRQVLEAWRRQAIAQTQKDLLGWSGQVDAGADERVDGLYRPGRAGQSNSGQSYTGRAHPNGAGPWPALDSNDLPTVPISGVAPVDVDEKNVPNQRPAPGQHEDDWS
jgi:uncharacterized coiled-coil protein SlyX